MSYQEVKLEFLQADAGHSDDGIIHEKKTPFFIIAQAVSGRYEVSSALGHVTAAGKQVFLMPPNISMRIVHHGAQPGSRMDYRYVHLHASIFEAVDVFRFFEFPAVSDNESGKVLGELIEELIFDEQDKRMDPIRISAKTMELGYRILNLLLNLGQPGVNRLTLDGMTQELAPVFLYIRDSMAEPITLDDLIACSNLSRTSLFYKFKTCLNKTPMEYVKYVRLREAYNRLRTTSDTVGEIAEYCGFLSLAHFCREFKQEFHMTPLTVRKSGM